MVPILETVAILILYVADGLYVKQPARGVYMLILVFVSGN